LQECETVAHLPTHRKGIRQENALSVASDPSDANPSECLPGEDIARKQPLRSWIPILKCRGSSNVSFTLTSTKCCIGNSCCDNWTIGGLDVRLLLPPRGPEACVFHGEATQLGRLTHSNPTATFAPSGCSSSNGTPPPAQPVSEAIFVFGTGDDDLRSGSELDVSFFKPDMTLIESGILKVSGAPKFDNNTQNTEVYTFSTGPHPLSDIGSITISMNNSGNDEWHLFGLNVVADTPGGPQNCLFDAQGEPLQVLKSSTLSMTLTSGAGCP
jgi:hypothetical protein